MDDAKQTEFRQKLKALLDEYGVDLALDWYDYEACRLVVQERPGEDEAVDVDAIRINPPYVPPPPRAPGPVVVELTAAQRKTEQERMEEHYRSVDASRRAMGVLQGAAPEPEKPGFLRRLAQEIYPPFFILAFFAVMFRVLGAW